MPGVIAVILTLAVGALTAGANAAPVTSGGLTAAAAQQAPASPPTLAFTHLDYDGGYTGTLDLTANRDLATGLSRSTCQRHGRHRLLVS